VEAWSKMLGYISCTNQVTANFALKFPNFRDYGNKVQWRGCENGDISLSSSDIYCFANLHEF